MLRLSAMIGFLVFLNFASVANALTCEGWKDRCAGECPAAMKIGAPKGCTCAERYALCKQTGTWMSWDRKRGIQADK
jgi:hypothetical protein